MKPPLVVEAHVNVFDVHIEYDTAMGLVEGNPKSYAYRAKSYISRSFAIVALLWCAAMTGWPTTIVAVRTPIDVSIAADSIATFESAAPESVCKIYRIGTIFLGVAGVDHDPITKFNVSDIVYKAIRSVQGFNSKMASAERAIIPALRAEMLNLKSTRPKEFEIAKNNGVSIMFVGFQNKIPFVIAQSFTISLGSNGDVLVTPSKVKRCPGNDCPNGVYVVRMGTTGPSRNILLIRKQNKSSPNNLPRSSFNSKLTIRWLKQ